MAWQNLLHSSCLSRWRERPGGRARLASFIVCVVAMFVVGSACGGQLPGAPDAGLLTISGYVYQEGTAQLGEPAVLGALITVQEGEGSARTAISDSRGFYTVSVRAGSVSITASKTGYAERVSQFNLSIDTILNFSLMPA
jgi:carboxypeptidase family protein